jgi:ribose transport system permease protein
VLAIGVEGLQLLSGATWLSAMFNGVALIAAVALAVTRSGVRPRFRKRTTSESDVGDPDTVATNEVQSASRSIV